MIKVKVGSVAHRVLMALHIPYEAVPRNWQEALFCTVMRLKRQHHNGHELDDEKIAPLLKLFEQAVARGWSQAPANETLAFMLRAENTPEEAALLIEALAEKGYITEQDFHELVWSTMPTA
ncbi:hypothetical protein [Ruminiclostridium josui]|uniref:hypothetical protein n=1 Tax=Ruminiclostridium josui TaxID=1499 RepID=UPI0005539CA4|nr:hypothetical protein [Ruminiclostridium josui]